LLLLKEVDQVVAIVRGILVLWLALVLLLWGGEAQAGQLAERLAQFPHWESKPPVTAAEGDLVYPDWMEGTWNVTSTLVDQVAPLAPEVVTPGFESNRRYLNQPVSFLVRFQALSNPPSGRVPATQTEISDRFLPLKTPTGRVSFGKGSEYRRAQNSKLKTFGVVADRAFNGLNIGRAYLGDRVIQSVKVDPDSPNRQITSLRTGRQLISVVTGRASETPTPDQFIATEVSNQVFRGTAQPYFNQVETTTAYQLLRSADRSVRLNFGKRSTERSRRSLSYRADSELVELHAEVSASLSPSSAIEADQVTAVYLSPQDSDYFKAQARPVALYRYRLQLLPVESTAASSPAE
jgi:hypothetical protein